MKVITVINDKDDKYFNLLRLSCALNGLELVVLVSKEQDFYSMKLKDQLLLAYLDEINDDELILFTDGTDAIFIADEVEILEKFSKFDSDLVFSAETGCWPDKGLAKFYDCCENTPYIYLNSGGFIGRAGLIKELLSKTKENDIESNTYSNQFVWANCYLKNKDRIKLDKFCEIFCTFYTDFGEEFVISDIDKCYTMKNQWIEENFQIENHRLYNKMTKSFPCQLHFNGNSKAFLDDKIYNLVYSAIPNYKSVQFYQEM